MQYFLVSRQIDICNHSKYRLKCQKQKWVYYYLAFYTSVMFQIVLHISSRMTEVYVPWVSKQKMFTKMVMNNTNSTPQIY